MAGLGSARRRAGRKAILQVTTSHHHHAIAKIVLGLPGGSFGAKSLPHIGELGECASDGNIPFSWLDAAAKAEGPPPDDIDDEDSDPDKPTRASKKGPGGLIVPYISDAFCQTLVADRDPAGLDAPH